MRQTAAWLIIPSMLVALLAGGLFSTLAWVYQSNSREVPPTVEANFTPVPAVARPVAGTPAATPVATTPVATELPAAFVANVENGRQVYARFCNSCHPNGGAGVGPTVRGADFKRKFADDDALKKVIRDGRGTMPAFRQIGDKEMNDLVAYMHTLD